MAVTTTLALVALGIFLVNYCVHIGNGPKAPSTSQLVLNSGTGWYPTFLTSFLSIFKTREWVFKEYARVFSDILLRSCFWRKLTISLQASKASAFFLLETLDRGKFLIVPPTSAKDIYSLPESILDVSKTADESIQAAWTVWDDLITDVPLHMHVVRNQITKNLGLLTPVIARELEEGFEREWGTSTTEWRSVHPWTTTLRVTAGAANAAFCGPPLCTIILTQATWTATDTPR